MADQSFMEAVAKSIERESIREQEMRAEMRAFYRSLLDNPEMLRRLPSRNGRDQDHG